MRSFIVFLLFIISFTSEAQNYYLFIGTYTNTGSKGIYVYRFDASTGKLTWASNTDSLVNPSYLSLSPDGKFLYACTETRTANAGSVSAFAFDAKNGKLTFLNKQSSGGDNPVYVTVHKSRKWIALGNYSGGNLAVFPVNKDGSLQPYRQLIQHTGSSINKERQEKAHVHSTIFSPDHNFLFAPDLGMDKVMGYRFREKEAQPLTVAGDGYKALAGSGPRHLCFRPDGKFAYLAEEMAGAVVVFKYTAQSGKLDPIQTLVTHRDTARALLVLLISILRRMGGSCMCRTGEKRITLPFIRSTEHGQLNDSRISIHGRDGAPKFYCGAVGKIFIGCQPGER
jgi:6-phosphogluconolactonase